MVQRITGADGLGKTAVIYLRVSTREQARRGGELEGYSIPAQREACLKYIREELHIATPPVEFVDAGASAKSADRDGLQHMLNFIAKRHPTYLVVHKLDRLARNRTDDLTITLALKQAGTALVSVMEHIDETPQGKLMHGMQSALAEYYVDNLALEVKKGTLQKVKRGGTATRAPLGYRNVGQIVNDFEERVVTIDEDRAPHIQWLFEQYATGEWSFERLAEAVTERGLTLRPTKTRPAGPVNFKQVAAILTNRYYLGYVSYGGVEYPGKHPPLITPELFAKVQDTIAAHRKSGERSHKHHHYLTGTVKCGRCGSGLIYNIVTGGSGGKYDYFTCLNRLAGQGCDLPYLHADTVEAEVEQIWRNEQLTPEQLDYLRETATSEISRQEKEHSKESSLIGRRIAALDAERLKWAEAAVDGTAPTDIVRDKQTALANQLANLSAQKQEIVSLGSTHRNRLDEICRLYEACGQGYLTASPRVRRAYNHAWFDKILIDAEDSQHIEPTAANRQTIHLTSQTEHREPFNHITSTIRETRQNDIRDPNPTKNAPNSASTSHVATCDLSDPNQTMTTTKPAKLVRLGSNSPHSSNIKPLVGATGFEPAISCSQSRRATKLRHAPYAGESSRCGAGTPKWPGRGHQCCGQVVIFDVGLASDARAHGVSHVLT